MWPKSKLVNWIGTLGAALVALTAILVSPVSAAKVGYALSGATGVSKLIDGTVGGTLKSGKWTLEIPAGAFNGTATISMTEIVATDGCPTVDLAISNPALNNFSRPVWLSHKDKANADRSIYWWDPSAQVWREVPGLIRGLLDSLGIELKVPLFHFSTYSVRGGKAGW